MSLKVTRISWKVSLALDFDLLIFLSFNTRPYHSKGKALEATLLSSLSQS